MRRRRKRPGMQKEKIIMMAASVFVLTALTMTGIYVKEKNDKDNTDGYVVDFSKLEQQPGQKDLALLDDDSDKYANNDMDADPNYEKANSGNVEIPGVTAYLDDQVKDADDQLPNGQAAVEEAKEEEPTKEDAKETASNAISNLSFKNDEYLQWPIVGNVLLNYSMDKTVYFSTLEQYKYNPAIVISAVEGEPIVASQEGIVSSVFTNEEIGNGISVNLGSGYELTYGQLDNIAVKEGDSLYKGQIIGYVAKPSKYYSVEGSNVYFKLTKDGTPVNPMSKLK